MVKALIPTTQQSYIICFFLIAFYGSFLLLSLSGCVVQKHSVEGVKPDNRSLTIEQHENVQRLEQDLVLLLGYSDKEASRLAETAFERTDYLSKQYRITHSARFHNFLVNLGVKDRGLCCHWTQDLLQALYKLNLKKYKFSWVVSNYGSLREHSSVVVFTGDSMSNDGLILDPWRNAGKLYWAKIATDDYEWHPHPDYKGKNSIKCEEGIVKKGR